MSLVDSPQTQRERIAHARKVVRARDILAKLTEHDDGSGWDDDLYVARCRLDNWLTEQPDYVVRAIS